MRSTRCSWSQGASHWPARCSRTCSCATPTSSRRRVRHRAGAGRAGGPGMQPLIEYRLELAGFSTRALELEGDGAPIVLLHGYGDSADTWRLVLDRVARSERRAIALDLPGFGTADRLRPGEPVLPQYDAFAAAAIEHVVQDAGDGARAVVGGNSLGGCIALRAGE